MNKNSKDFSYIQTVEEFYIYLKKHGLMLSGRELQQVEKWKNMGIPLQIVLKAIFKGINDFKKKYPKKIQLPRTIKYYTPFIISEAKKYKTLGGNILYAEKTEQKGRKKFEKALKTFRDFASKEKNPAVAKIYKEVYGILAQFMEREKNKARFEENLIEEIKKVESHIVSRLKECVEQNEWESFSLKVEKKVNEKIASLGEIARESIYELTFKELLFEKFNISIDLFKKFCEI